MSISELVSILLAFSVNLSLRPLFLPFNVSHVSLAYSYR